MKDGYIKLHRKLFESKMWLDEPFTVGQAWVDLIAMANYANKDHFFRGSVQRVMRGQVITSKAALANRWKWSDGKVRRYLANLERLEMVHTDSSTNGVVITIENYGVYQDARRTNKRTNDEQTTSERRADDERTTTQEERKERKERKKGNNAHISASSIPTLEEVSLFISEENLDVDPDRFWNYYEGVGWKIGGRPIENWQAVCRRWNGTEDYGKKKSGGSGSVDWDEVNRLLDIMESGGNIYDQT